MTYMWAEQRADQEDSEARREETHDREGGWWGGGGGREGERRTPRSWVVVYREWGDFIRLVMIVIHLLAAEEWSASSSGRLRTVHPPRFRNRVELSLDRETTWTVWASGLRTRVDSSQGSETRTDYSRNAKEERNGSNPEAQWKGLNWTEKIICSIIVSFLQPTQGNFYN